MTCLLDTKKICVSSQVVLLVETLVHVELVFEDAYYT